MNLQSTNDLISFYYSMTSTELKEVFPNYFESLLTVEDTMEASNILARNEARLWKLIVKNMQAQKQRLEIGMFIPMDEEGNLWLEPTKQNSGSQIAFQQAKIMYHKLQSKILFNDFKMNVGDDKISFTLAQKDETRYWIEYDINSKKFKHYERIEDLIPLNISITDNYLKLIT